MMIPEQLSQVALLQSWCWANEIHYKAFHPTEAMQLLKVSNGLFDIFDKYSQEKTGPLEQAKLISHMLDEMVGDGSGLNEDIVKMYPALRQAQAALEAAINQVEVPDLEV